MSTMTPPTLKTETLHTLAGLDWLTAGTSAALLYDGRVGDRPTAMQSHVMVYDLFEAVVHQQLAATAFASAGRSVRGSHLAAACTLHLHARRFDRVLVQNAGVLLHDLTYEPPLFAEFHRILKASGHLALVPGAIDLPDDLRPLLRDHGFALSCPAELREGLPGDAILAQRVP